MLSHGISYLVPVLIAVAIVMATTLLARRLSAKSLSCWTWTRLPSLPAPRYDHALVAARDGAIIALGGHPRPGGTPCWDMWRLDARSTSWREHAAPGSESITPRGSYAWEVLGDKTVVVGGFGETGNMADFAAVHLVTGAIESLDKVSGTAPSRRSGATLTALGSDRAVLFGGFGLLPKGTDGSLNDVHVLTLGSGTKRWEPVTIEGPGPDARCAHTAVRLGAEVCIFGGYGRVKPLNDSWALSLEARAGSGWVGRWRRFEPAGELPAGRSGHSAVALDDHRLLVYGGMDATAARDDLHLFCARSQEWTAIGAVTGDAPGPRYNHRVTITRLRGKRVMAVAGGFNEENDAVGECFALELPK